MAEGTKRYKVRPSTDGQYYYVQVSKQGEDLNTSELYTRRDDAVRGVHDANPDEGVEIVHEYEVAEEQEKYVSKEDLDEGGPSGTER